jgi:hypothetical protein
VARAHVDQAIAIAALLHLGALDVGRAALARPKLQELRIVVHFVFAFESRRQISSMQPRHVTFDLFVVQRLPSGARPQSAGADAVALACTSSRSARCIDVDIEPDAIS